MSINTELNEIIENIFETTKVNRSDQYNFSVVSNSISENFAENGIKNLNLKNFVSEINEHNACTNSQIKNQFSRKNNLVIFGIDDKHDDLDQNNHDEMIVKQLITSLRVDINDSDIIECKRLETRKSNLKSKPILIRLASYKTKSEILKKARDLKQSTEFRNVSITPDYSIKKRLVIKVLLRTKIELNKQLRTTMPNANFYFSIQDCKLVMKSTVIKNSLMRFNDKTKTIDERAIDEKIEKCNRDVTQKLENLDQKLASIENGIITLMEIRQDLSKLDKLEQIEAFLIKTLEERTSFKLEYSNET